MLPRSLPQRLPAIIALSHLQQIPHVLPGPLYLPSQIRPWYALALLSGDADYFPDQALVSQQPRVAAILEGLDGGPLSQAACTR